MNLYYDMDGKPMELMEWATAHEGERHIGDTKIDDVRVSTVWLGADHSLGFDGPPLIFETMIFGGPHDNFCERYSTKEEAAEGHQRIVSALQEGRDPGEVDR